MAALAFDQLKYFFRGELIQPASPDLDFARYASNGMAARHPRLIARCLDVADVVAAVRYGNQHQLSTAVRGGRYQPATLGGCEDGLIIDLSPMKAIRQDAQPAAIHVEAGCIWGDVDHAAHAFGMAAPTGFLTTSGFSGITPGGGIGYLARQYDLTLEHLLAIDMVLADGSFVTANADRNKDLFWAVRFGGGNFGVVTAYTFGRKPETTVHFGPMVWPVQQAAAVLSAYRDFIRTAPDTVRGFFAFLTVPALPAFPRHLHGNTVCGIFWACTGAQEAVSPLDPMRRVGSLLFDAVVPTSFAAFQAYFDSLYSPGLQWYWRADNFSALEETAIARHAEYGATIHTPQSAVQIYPVSAGATRHAERRPVLFSDVIVAATDAAENLEATATWCRDYWEALRPYSAGRDYLNSLVEKGQQQAQSNFRANYHRLFQLKRRYDPGNFFRISRNVQAV